MPVPVWRPAADKGKFRKKQCDERNESDDRSTQSMLEGLRMVSSELPVMLETPRDEGDEGGSLHQRGQSLHVNWTLEDVARMAREVYDETIPDVHLSLFGYWIRESEEHYDTAKQCIRELSLDQGYNVQRIENVHLRKLLADVHQIRPKCVYGSGSPQGLLTADRAPDGRQGRLSNILASIAVRDKRPFGGTRGFVRPMTNGVSLREPLHAAAVRFQTLITTPTRGRATKNRSTSFSVTAKTESLPPSLKANRERAMREATRSTSLSSKSSPRQDYPPDTPDRPAPLNLRSRNSRESTCVTPNTTHLPRSIPSPADRKYPITLIPLPLPRNSVILEATASHPLLSVSVRTSNRANSEAGTDDIFGVVDGEAIRQGDNVDDIYDVAERQIRDISSRYASSEPYDQHTPGSYVEVSFDASHGANETHSMNRNADIRASFMGEGDHILQDGTIDTKSPCSGLDDDWEISILKTATSSQKQYLYTVQASPPDPIMTEPASVLSQRGTVVAARHKIKSPKPMVTATNFHCPLPLRSYKSEAHLYPTSRAQGDSNHNRATSAHDNILRCNRPASPAMDALPFVQEIPLPPRSGSITAQVNPLSSRSASRMTFGDPYQRHHTSLPTPVAHFGEAGACHNLKEPHTNIDAQHFSVASTLAAFPIPPMENLVGKLPMTVSCATALTEQRATNSTSIAEAYRAITQAYIAELLRRTRQKGAHLPVWDWDELSTFERAWREANEPLLVSIYGGKDTVLTSQDVQYVDCISRELRDGTYSNNWVRDIFQTGL